MFLSAWHHSRRSDYSQFHQSAPFARIGQAKGLCRAAFAQTDSVASHPVRTQSTTLGGPVVNHASCHAESIENRCRGRELTIYLSTKATLKARERALLMEKLILKREGRSDTTTAKSRESIARPRSGNYCKYPLPRNSDDPNQLLQPIWGFRLSATLYKEFACTISYLEFSLNLPTNQARYPRIHLKTLCAPRYTSQQTCIRTWCCPKFWADI